VDARCGETARIAHRGEKEAPPIRGLARASFFAGPSTVAPARRPLDHESPGPRDILG